MVILGVLTVPWIRSNVKKNNANNQKQNIMTNAEYNFSSDAKQAGLVIGAHIKITKIEKKEGLFSSVNVGDFKEGHISTKLSLNNALYFFEHARQNMTSELKKVFKKENKTYIETRTSIYEVTFY